MHFYMMMTSMMLWNHYYSATDVLKILYTEVTMYIFVARSNQSTETKRKMKKRFNHRLHVLIAHTHFLFSSHSLVNREKNIFYTCFITYIQVIGFLPI